MTTRFSLGANYWSRAGGPRMWTRFDRKLVREELSWARTIGLDALRAFLFWPDLEPEPRVLADAPWDAVRQFLDEALEAGLKIWPTLLVGHMSGENWDPPWRAGRDLWTDPEMLAETEWFLRAAVARLAGHPAVGGFVLTNEWPLWAGSTSRPVAQRWLARMTEAVRQADGGRHPISMGDGAWSGFGRPNGLSPDVLETYTDVVGPHVYPEAEDPLAVAMAAYEAVATARGRRPVLLEEFGTTDGFGSRESQGAYYRSVLAGSLIGGAIGAWAWCLNDFALPNEAPYAHHPFEQRFGLLTTDGTPKPTAEALREFRELADAFGSVLFDPVAVLIPAVQAGVVPFPRGPEPQVVTAVARHMLREWAQQGLNAEVIREAPPEIVSQSGSALPALDRFRLIAVAAPRLGEPARMALEEWVRAGGTLYVAYSDAPWWPDPEAFLGVRWTGPYGVRYRVDRGRLHVEAESWAVSWDARDIAYRPAEPVDAEVVALVEGRPALFRRTVGQGQIVTSVVGWEEEPSVTSRWYRQLARLAGVEPVVPLPRRAMQCGRSATGVVVVVNHGETAVVWTPRTWQGHALLNRDGRPASEPVVLEPHRWWWGRLP